MAVSRRLRFEILRRDDHTCRYCGASAPDVKLTVDHVMPEALGGSDDPSNLVTACEACNGGKSSIAPDSPLVAEVAADAIRWARAMKQATEAWRANERIRQQVRLDVYELWTGWTYESNGERKTVALPADWAPSVDNLMAAGLGILDFEQAIEITMTRRGVKDEWRYMCGVLWTRIAQRQEIARQILGAEEADSDGS